MKYDNIIIISFSQLAPIVGLNFPDSFIELGKYVSCTIFHKNIHTKSIFCVPIMHLQCIFLGVHLVSTSYMTSVSMTR